MIERNESNSGMGDFMGQSVPKIKAIMSHDMKSGLGHSVPMSEDYEDITETAWREAFRQRVRQIQGDRTQEDMADLLCISRDAYSKYVGSRASAMPMRLLPKLAKIGAVSLEWLIEGPKAEKAQKSAKQPSRPAKVARR